MTELDPEERALRQKTLSGDIAHRFHKLVTAHFPECWEEMGEAEQREFNEDLRRFAFRTAEQAIDLALGAGLQPFTTTLSEIHLVKRPSIKLDLPPMSLADLQAFVGAYGQPVKLVGPFVRLFQGDVEPLPVLREQGDLVEDVVRAGNGADEPERPAGMGPEEAAEVARIWAVQDAARREAEAGAAEEERSVPRFEPTPEEELEAQQPRPRSRGRTRQPNTGVYRHEPAPA